MRGGSLAMWAGGRRGRGTLSQPVPAAAFCRQAAIQSAPPGAGSGEHVARQTAVLPIVRQVRAACPTPTSPALRPDARPFLPATPLHWCPHPCHAVILPCPALLRPPPLPPAAPAPRQPSAGMPSILASCRPSAKQGGTPPTWQHGWWLAVRAVLTRTPTGT